jgi:hypothetical protein
MRKKEENNMKDSAPEQVRHRVAEVTFRPSVPRLKMARQSQGANSGNTG